MSRRAPLKNSAFPYPLRSIGIAFVGPRPFYSKQVRASVLDVLLSLEPLTPETYGREQRGQLPFDRDTVCAEDYRPSRELFLIRRKKTISYDLMLGFDRWPHLVMKFPPKKIRAEDIRLIFSGADEMARAYEPDMGWVQFFGDYRWPSKEPEVAMQILMDLGCSGHISDYEEHGPGALGLRTYLGPYVVRQIGKKRLLSLPEPCLVTEQDWGGIRVDLVEEPWRSDASTLRKIWQKAMEHLRPAEFFATPTIHSNGAVTWKRGAKCDPGGQVR